MAPDPESIKVAIQSLRTASKEWHEQHQPLTEAAGATQGRIDFTATQMGLAAPIHGPYHQICTGMHTILLEAAKEADNLGDALKHAADGYQKDEDDGTHKLKGVW